MNATVLYPVVIYASETGMDVMREAQNDIF